MSKLFSIDAETDGLYGLAFSIGVTVLQDGEEIDRFIGRCPYRGSNEWVITNVLPTLNDIPITHNSNVDLAEAFWEYWLKHREDTIVIAHCHSPVETGLFRRCVERDVTARQWLSPYPAIHDVATLLMLLGEQPDSVDLYVEKHAIKKPVGITHNPYYDAIVAASVWEHTCKRLNK